MNLFLESPSRIRTRIYPPLPPQERLRRWCKRIARNTSPFPRPHRLKMPQRLVEVLGLPDDDVVIDEQGNLLHTSCVEPIAYV